MNKIVSIDRMPGIAWGNGPFGEADILLSDRKRLAQAPPPGAVGTRAYSLRSIKDGLELARSIIINLIIIGVVILFGVLAYREVTRNEVLLEPFSVPTRLQETGITGEVAARRLQDKVALVLEAKKSRRESTLKVLPSGDAPDFSLPDSGLSLQSLVRAIRDMLHLPQSRIGGEIFCGNSACAEADWTIRVRVVTEQGTVQTVTVTGPVAYREAAFGVLRILEPITGALTEQDYHPLDAMAIANNLAETGSLDAKWAHNLIGTISANYGNYSGACDEYHLALRLDSTFTSALHNKALCLETLGRLKEANEQYAALRAIDGSDELSTIGYARTNALLDPKRSEESMTLIADAAKRHPTDPVYYYTLGSASENLMPVALHYYDLALAIDPTYPPAFAKVATYDYSNHRETDLATLKQTAAGRPGEALALYAFAQELFDQRAWNQAWEEINVALHLDPDNTLFHLQRARILAMIDPIGGLSEMRDVTNTIPPSPMVLKDLATLFFQLGCLDEARATYRVGLEYAGNYTAATSALAGLSWATAPTWNPVAEGAEWCHP